MKWSIKNDYCISCNSTYYKHKGKGLCSKCYSISTEIKKLDNASENELDNFILKYISSLDKNKLKSLDINMQKEEIKNIIISKKLKYLIQYGQIESNKIKVDIVKIETILNEISRRAVLASPK